MRVRFVDFLLVFLMYNMYIFYIYGRLFATVVIFMCRMQTVVEMYSTYRSMKFKCCKLEQFCKYVYIRKVFICSL